MLENSKDRFIFTKSYEIAYALFRMAEQMREKDIAERLRTLGGSLLQASAGQDYAEAARHLQVIECMAKFAGDVNAVSPANANILLGEIYTLDATIIERRNSAHDDQLNLADIFSKSEFEAAAATASPTAATATAAASPADEAMHYEYPANNNPANGKNGNPAMERNADNEAAEKGASSINAEVRQSAIMERIRRSGSCRLKDIQEVLPDTSERTIRYDLQSLVEKNLIERIGSGGPAVFYRMRPAAQG